MILKTQPIKTTNELIPALVQQGASIRALLLWTNSRNSMPYSYHFRVDAPLMDIVEKLAVEPGFYYFSEPGPNNKIKLKDNNKWLPNYAIYDFVSCILKLDAEIDGDTEYCDVQMVYDALNPELGLELIDYLQETFPRSEEKKSSAPISILIKCGNHISTRVYQLPAPIIPDFEIAYGNAFTEANNKIVDAITEMKSGVVILHGLPGCGKTTYIRHMAALYGRDRTFLYVPTISADALDSPDLIETILDLNAPVVIVEDAEPILSNQGGRKPGLSSLLNLSDGLVGMAARVMLILTHNAKVDSIDPALMRPGRLIAHHEFGTLTIDRARKMFIALGLDPSLAKDKMTLAEIYNIAPPSTKKEKLIGFKNGGTGYRINNKPQVVDVARY